MIKLPLLASVFLLFYSLTVGVFPDADNVRRLVVRHGVSGMYALLAFLLASTVFQTPLAGLVWGVFGWLVPGWIGKSIEGKRRARLKNMVKDFVASAAGLYAVGQVTPEVIRTVADRFAEPLAGEFRNVLAARNLNPNVSIPRMMGDTARKYRVPELEAVAAILAASERIGGPAAASRGLKRLGQALRQRDRLQTERAKATLEPRLAAVVVISILVMGLALDVTIFSGLFRGQGRMVLALSSALVAGLVLLANKISASDDLE